MAEAFDGDGLLSGERTGKQAYFLEVPGTDSAQALSVVAFEATERFGEPHRITIRVTHRLELPRADYLGRNARFSIVPDIGEGRTFDGWITAFAKLSASRDESTYEISLEAHLSRLARTHTSRVFQHATPPTIIAQVLRRHGFKGHQFSFTLRRKYQEHALRFQYQMNDLAWVQLLMKQEGIYSYITHGRHGDSIVFGDDIDHYVYQPRKAVPYREPAGLNAAAESVYSLVTRTCSVPELVQVAAYNPDRAWERFRDEANTARNDTTTYGQPYIWGTGHLDAEGAKWEAQLRHEAEIASQVVYEGRSNVLGLHPGRILHIDEVLPDAPHGQVIVEVVHQGARDRPYSNTYKAIPADRRFRLPLDEDNWPKVHGTLTARITAPNSYKYAYITDQGDYVARLDVDFDDWPKGGELVPLRLAKPFAGARETGFHFPLIDGTEVNVAFDAGNPNRPYIANAMHNSQSVDLVTSHRRWMSRNVIRTQANNKLRMEDWEGEESIKLSTEHSGKTQLNMGYLVDAGRQKRGAGAELRTSGHAVTRGGAGVMVTAYDQPGAGGKQLAMVEVVAQLRELLTLAESLAQSADASKASPADTSALKAINDALNELNKPGVLVSAPGPVGVVSGDGIELGSDGSIIATAGKGMHFSVLRRFTVAARDVVSFFTQKGMSLIAAAGAVVVQAQRGRMQLAAQEDVTVESVDGVLHVKSPKEIVLNVGGSYLRMAPDGIELGTRGAIRLRSAGLSKSGPAQLDLGGAAFAPKFVPFKTDCEVWRTNANFVQETAPTPEGMKNTGAVPPAPSPDGSYGESLPPQIPFPPGSGAIGTGKVTINDPENASVESRDNPEPVELKTAVPCNWQLDKFTSLASMVRETPRYHRYQDRNTGPEKKADGTFIETGGTAPTKCRFSYDPDSRVLTAKVVIAFIPRLLVRMNPATKEPLS
jgi:type VI secretion system secreted protein VgrG